MGTRKQNQTLSRIRPVQVWHARKAALDMLARSKQAQVPEHCSGCLQRHTCCLGQRRGNSVQTFVYVHKGKGTQGAITHVQSVRCLDTVGLTLTPSHPGPIAVRYVPHIERIPPSRMYCTQAPEEPLQVSIPTCPSKEKVLSAWAADLEVSRYAIATGASVGKSARRLFHHATRECHPIPSAPPKWHHTAVLGRWSQRPTGPESPAFFSP